MWLGRPNWSAFGRERVREKVNGQLSWAQRLRQFEPFLDGAPERAMLAEESGDG